MLNKSAAGANARYADDAARDGAPVRVLIYNELGSGAPERLHGMERTIVVAGLARPGDDLTAQARTLCPDVLLIMASGRFPGQFLQEQLSGLNGAGLCERAVVMAEDPAGYLTAAVKERVGGLLQLGASEMHLLSVLLEVANAHRHRRETLLGDGTDNAASAGEVTPM